MLLNSTGYKHCVAASSVLLLFLVLRVFFLFVFEMFDSYLAMAAWPLGDGNKQFLLFSDIL